MKHHHSKTNESTQRDGLPFVKNGSAAEIYESRPSQKTNRENQPPRGRHHDSKQQINLDAFFGIPANQTMMSKDTEALAAHITSQSSLHDRKRHQTSKEAVTPTPSPLLLQLQNGSQTTLNSAEDEQHRLLLKLVRQTRSQLDDKQKQSESRVRQELSIFRTLFAEVRRQLEEVERRTSLQTKKLTETCSSIKLEYRNAFKQLVEQVNGKFTSNDKAIFELREQGAVVRSSFELFQEELAKKIKEMQADQLELLTRFNNNIRVEELSNSMFVAELQSDNEHCFDNEDSIKEAPVNTELQEKLEELAQEVKKLKLQSSNAQLLAASFVKPTDTIEHLELFKSQLMEGVSKGTRQAMRDLQVRLEQQGERMSQLVEQVRSLSKTGCDEGDSLKARLSLLETKWRDQSSSEKTEEETDDVSVSAPAAFAELAQLKAELQEKLKHSRVISTKKAVGKEKSAANALKNITDTYLLDEQQYLMDCEANYILDDSNQRIQVQPDQIYFMSLHGINITNISSG